MLALHGGRDRKPKASAPNTAAIVPVDPPKSMPADQLKIWKALAPHALEMLTLTPATAESFADLCRAISIRDSLLATIEEQGWTFRKAHLSEEGEVLSEEIKKHPLVADHRGWEQRVEAGRARFRLAPIGKEIAPKVPEVDPWAEFDQAGSQG